MTVVTTGSSMNISEAAAASGCHFETIRYYERIGLIAKPGRRPNGYRHYTERDVSQLRFIIRSRELGFGLDEVRKLLTMSDHAERSCSEVDELARRQLDAVKLRIRELRRTARELERTIGECVKQSCGNCSILGALRSESGTRTAAD
jgi:MerR family transcriptional regulator, mercuric resistance operon regulatory protein